MADLPAQVVDANALRRYLDQQAAVIRMRGELSADGRRLSLAQLWLEGYQTMASIKSEWRQALETQRRTLERAVFGTPANFDPVAEVAAASNYRDALDRADRCQNPEEALRLLERAGRVGDDLLARAIVTVAMERIGPLESGWRQVVRAYVDDHPQAGADIAELLAVQTQLAPAAHDRLLQDAWFTMPVFSEVGSSDPTMVEQLARQLQSAMQHTGA